MKLVHLLDGRVAVEPPATFRTPVGTRHILGTRGGEFEGPRLRGEILANGGDWALDPGDGASRLDIRSAFRTHDGTDLYVEARGVLVFNPAATEALLKGGEIQFGDTYFTTAVHFAVDPESAYAWLNHVVGVSQGRFGPGFVEYRIYEVEN